MSFFRLDFSTAKDVARECGHPAGAYVVMLRVRDLNSLNLSVIPSPVEKLPGHVIVPELSYAAYKSNKRSIDEKLQQIALWASQRIVFGPTPPRSSGG